MGRSSFVVKVGRLLQALPLRALQCLEWPWLFNCRANVPSAVFILAIPRGGSTLSFQVICHSMVVLYLSNIWNLLFQLPLFGGIVSKVLTRRHCSEFLSQHGFVEGLDGPAEGLRFWEWWLGCGLSDESCRSMPADRKHRRVVYISKVLKVLTSQNCPFVSAYLGHTLVPDTLASSFPDAVYIRIRRDPIANALSLLRSTRQSGGTWFSVVPQECKDEEGLNEHERVAAQVYWLNRRLDDSEVSRRSLTVHYEALCENPGRELDRIRQHCADFGIKPPSRRPLPATFDFKTPDLVYDQDALKIKAALQSLELRHGKLAD
ncbi:MAG: sulfotransferase [Marinobacter sp.]